jgi:hypothetical protein
MVPAVNRDALRWGSAGWRDDVAREDARYLAIADVLLERIKDGTYPPGMCR